MKIFDSISSKVVAEYEVTGTLSKNSLRRTMEIMEGHRKKYFILAEVLFYHSKAMILTAFFE